MWPKVLRSSLWTLNVRLYHAWKTTSSCSGFSACDHMFGQDGVGHSPSASCHGTFKQWMAPRFYTTVELACTCGWHIPALQHVRWREWLMSKMPHENSNYLWYPKLPYIGPDLTNLCCVWGASNTFQPVFSPNFCIHQHVVCRLNRKYPLAFKVPSPKVIDSTCTEGCA